MSENTRVVSDERLDSLYMKSMRCPYCHSKIEKGAAACKTCGISKLQIYQASMVNFKEHKRSQIIYSKVRPRRLPFWKMAISGMFGFTGIHCFIAKRYWRGAIIATLMVLFIILSLIIFPPATQTIKGETIDAHAWRSMFESNGFWFPPDLLGIVGMAMWVWDWFAILFNQFKYPVVLDKDEASK